MLNTQKSYFKQRKNLKVLIHMGFELWPKE